jgi:hypothetical protein
MTILDEFDATAPSFKEFTEKLHSLVEDFLRVNNIIVHNISSQPKTRSSVERKYYDNITKYPSLAE